MKGLGMWCVVAGLLVPWVGQAQQLETTFDDWRVLTMQEKTGKVCYVTSVPVQKEGNVAKRDQPYAMVTAWGKGATEVSVASGYPYKVDSAIELIVDNTSKYQLYSNKKVLKVAWGSNPSEHKKIIDRMLTGKQMVVNGTSQNKTTSKDSYSLKGFDKAYKAMKDLCSAAAPTTPKAAQETSSPTAAKESEKATAKGTEKPAHAVAQKPGQTATQKPAQKTSPKSSEKPSEKSSEKPSQASSSKTSSSPKP